MARDIKIHRRKLIAEIKKRFILSTNQKIHIEKKI